MRISHLSRKLLASSLSFFLLSSNFSFLGVVIPGQIAYATVPNQNDYNPYIQYSSGQTFSYDNNSITVTGTGMGVSSTKADPSCDTNDIAIWSGSLIQIWSACNAGTNIAGTGAGSYGGYFQWGNNADLSSAPVFTGQVNASSFQDSTYSSGVFLV